MGSALAGHFRLDVGFFPLQNSLHAFLYEPVWTPSEASELECN